MLSLTKKTDYALIALGYLADHPDTVVSAREIAEHYRMPAALVMNIMKTLHHGNMISSTRGTKGGYRLTADLSKVSMHDLICVLEGPIRLTECIVLDGESVETASCKIVRGCPIQKPIRNLHCRLVEFLREVKLSEIVQHGHNGRGRAAQAELAAASA
jgi:Rrf2 family protein